MTNTPKLAGLLCTVRNANSFQVVLPNGRNVELYSKEGADVFVDTFGTYFISTNLTATDDQELATAYIIMITVIEEASPEKIASGIPESELRTFIEQTRVTLDTLSTDRNWLRSGTVTRHHELLLRTVASFSKHPSFLKIFLSNEGMEAVAKFYASRKNNDTPSRSVAELIIRLVYNVICGLEQEGLSDEKGFGTIEKTGLLGQFIRCVPAVDPERSAKLVACLQTCVQLVKKKLKSGTRTGDILDAVIAGNDGPINEKAKAGLARLQSLARLSNNNNDSYDKRCRHCGKIETLGDAKLMKCQRCKLIYYCSKECQVANWKSHKKSCKAISSSTVSQSAHKTSNATMWAFFDSNYFDIVKEVYKKTQECNVAKTEILVEIDFYGDAPALRNEFKVWLTSGFLGASALVDAPDWFRSDGEKKTMSRYLRIKYAQVTSDDLLVVCRGGNGVITVQLLYFATNEGHQLLSDEAVESIGREDYVRMVACLGQSVTNKCFGKQSGLV
jgi:hypothetical protein